MSDLRSFGGWTGGVPVRSGEVGLLKGPDRIGLLRIVEDWDSYTVILAIGIFHCSQNNDSLVVKTMTAL